MNWDDLRAFLAVARLGSLRRAADALNVTQPTISRRIRILEPISACRCSTVTVTATG